MWADRRVRVTCQPTILRMGPSIETDSYHERRVNLRIRSNDVERKVDVMCVIGSCDIIKGLTVAKKAGFHVEVRSGDATLVLEGSDLSGLTELIDHWGKLTAAAARAADDTSPDSALDDEREARAHFWSWVQEYATVAETTSAGERARWERVPKVA